MTPVLLSKRVITLMTNLMNLLQRTIRRRERKENLRLVGPVPMMIIRPSLMNLTYFFRKSRGIYLIILKRKKKAYY